MAGLLAARVLTGVFDRVLVIDRDELPDGPEVRNGVPQGRHAHALLSEGQDLLESLFPGLSDELTQSGSPRMTWCRDTCYFTPGGWIKRFDSKIQTNVITRPDLEFRVRRRVAADSRVTFLTGREVQALTTTPDRSAVTGVKVSVRGTDAVEQHDADLVIDASGRGSKAPAWLEALGYPAPPETSVNSYVGYATRIYEKPPKEPDWKVLFINARSAENNPRGGVIFDMGGGQWMVSLGGLNKDYPPTDEEGFNAFMRRLPSPTLAEALQQAKPISPITGYRIPGSRQRHYEKLARRLENFILMGDSVCSFNPIYGQGITVAALEAVELGKMLEQHGRDNLAGFAAAFQTRIAATLRNAWILATGEDLRFPGTEGDRPGAAARMVQRYVDQYGKVAYDDELLTLTFMKVLNLAAAPTTLFAPKILWRVLSKSFNRSNTPNAAANPAVIPPIV